VSASRRSWPSGFAIFLINPVSRANRSVVSFWKVWNCNCSADISVRCAKKCD
jgi:hypothetical protein